MFSYWGVDLPDDFVAPPAETNMSFMLCCGSPRTDDFEVSSGDVIYGFANGRLVVACVILDMLTLPETQVVLTFGEDRCYLTTVVARVMPVRPEILYRSQWSTENGEPLAEAIRKAQRDSQAQGCPEIDGVVWPWWHTDLILGNQILDILDDDFREQKNAKEECERRKAQKELARGVTLR